MPDALVAASALVHGLSLMTRNRRHFAAVDGLDLVAPG
jgi:predicted nucleic acid-binding protein